jgi:Kef-type K+ transport system membrane component KefB
VLAALFFMAGMELDLERVRGRPLTLAIRGWGVSLVLGLAAAALLYILPKVHSPMMVGLALSTTALGTLLPSCGLLSVPRDSFLPIHRQRESEARSAARIVFCPDSSTVSFHDPPDN